MHVHGSHCAHIWHLWLALCSFLDLCFAWCSFLASVASIVLISCICGSHDRFHRSLRLDGPMQDFHKQRIHRLLETTSLETLHDVEQVLLSRREEFPDRTQNPSGSSQAGPCQGCGAPRPPDPSAPAWPIRKQSGRAQGSRCKACLWSERHKRPRSQWPGEACQSTRPQRTPEEKSGQSAEAGSSRPTSYRILSKRAG